MRQEILEKGVRKFRCQSQGYLFQKKWIRYLEENHPWLCTYALQEEQVRYDGQKNEVERQYALLKQQTEWVEDVLNRIEARYGYYARVLIEEQYIQQEKQVVVAKRYGISTRTLQRRNRKWLLGVFAS